MYYFQTSYNGYSVYKTLAVDLSGPLLTWSHAQITHAISCDATYVKSRPD